MNIASQIRHYLTFLAGLGGLFLSWQIIAPDQAAAVDKAGADLIDPVCVILGAVAAGVARLALGWIGSLFRSGAGEIGEKTRGFPFWMGLIGTAVALGGALPSCAPGEWPLRIGIEGEGYRADYSAKSGIEIRATIPDRHSNK